MMCFRKRDYVQNDVDIDVCQKYFHKSSTTGFSGKKSAALRLKCFPVFFWQVKKRERFVIKNSV